MSKQVAVASRSFSKHPVLRKELLQKFENVKFNDDGLSLTGDSLIGFLAEAERCIIALEKIDELVISKLPNLKHISKYGVGLDNIDQGVLEKYGVTFKYTPGVNKRSVAELTLGLMISTLRKFTSCTSLVNDQRGWTQIRGHELTGRKVGIIGLGNVGMEVVRFLQPFNCDIYINDIVDKSDECRKFDLKSVSKEELFRNCDIVLIHVPKNVDTIDLVSSDYLSSFGDGRILINTARGGIVNEGALLNWLVQNKKSYAAFDVLEVEPPENWTLIDHERFFITPHIGGSTEESVLAMGRAAINGLE